MDDSLLSQIAFDSLINASNQDLETGISWTYCSIHTSNDGLLKVYHFAGEECSRYCNPFYQTIVSIPNAMDHSDPIWEIEDFDFNIDSIVTLIDSELYLVFGNHRGRPRGVEGVWGQTVVLSSIYDGFEMKWSFSTTTSSLVQRDSPVSDISFDSDKMTI